MPSSPRSASTDRFSQGSANFPLKGPFGELVRCQVLTRVSDHALLFRQRYHDCLIPWHSKKCYWAQLVSVDGHLRRNILVQADQPIAVKVLDLVNSEFEGQNVVYLLTRGETVALVDTGFASSEIRTTLEDGLNAAGHGIEDVDIVLLTHWHYDHAGLAGEIQAASGATVYAHSADAGLIGQDEDAVEAMLRDRRRCLAEWGVPEDKRVELYATLENELALSGPAPAVEPLEDGDEVTVGDLCLRVLHAPGHAAGLACYEFPTDDGVEAFVGDALLPVYTPNVGGADVRVDRPLSKYVLTLKTLADRDYPRVWPGHRGVIENPTERAREILAHHRDRSGRILDILDEHGPADAWTISNQLFGELESVHIMHGPGEVHAHLAHLEDLGAVRRQNGAYSFVDDHCVTPSTLF